MKINYICPPKQSAQHMKCLNILFASLGDKTYPMYILPEDVNPDDVVKRFSQQDSQYSYHFRELPFWDNYKLTENSHD